MRRIRASACLATFILVGLANAADHEQKEQAAAAREKSAVLEEKASAEGIKTQPTPAEIITKQQVQSVDLIGDGWSHSPAPGHRPHCGGGPVYSGSETSIDIPALAGETRPVFRAGIRMFFHRHTAGTGLQAGCGGPVEGWRPIFLYPRP